MRSVISTSSLSNLTRASYLHIFRTRFNMIHVLNLKTIVNTETIYLSYFDYHEKDKWVGLRKKISKTKDSSKTKINKYFFLTI